MGSRILKKGLARRVVFYYPGEEGAYLENAEVTLLENGIVHVDTSDEETTTSIKNCEIIWKCKDAPRANAAQLVPLRNK